MTNMKAQSSIHIALSFDQNFWAPAYATMRSICLATHRRSELVFHLCHTELSSEAMADLEKISGEFGAQLVHCNLEDNVHYMKFAQSLPHSKAISAVMYGRLVFAHVIAKNVDRMIYIDCDIFVRAPIEALFDEDLMGKPLGAVTDPHAYRSSNGRDVNENRDIFDPADPYFNSGLLLIDLKAWRKMDLIVILQKLDAEGVLGRLINDQEILNFIFKNNWSEVDRSWNALACGRAMEIFDPKGVHYTGVDKPWNLISFAPFSRMYRHVMTNELFYRYWRFRMVKRMKGFALSLIGRKP